MYVFDDGIIDYGGAASEDVSDASLDTGSGGAGSTVEDWDSFIDAAGVAVCDLYWDCDYESIYNDSPMTCQADVHDAYSQTVIGTDCIYVQDIVEACISYIQNMPCDQILQFREGHNLCTQLCG